VVLQSWQFNQSEKDKNQAAEDARWEDAVKTISQSAKLSPAAISLGPFLRSPKYRDAAKSLVVQLLSNTTDRTFYSSLFGAAFVPVGWNNVDDVLKLDRAIKVRSDPLLDKTYDPKRDINDPGRLSPGEREVYNYANYVMADIASQVGSVLKAPRPKAATLNLSATAFHSADWSGADLRGSDITNISLAWVDLEAANLNSIAQFDGAYFYHVAWWTAKTIDPRLLRYLQADPTSMFRQGAVYGPKHVKFTRRQYEVALARLKGSPP
jgi:hypothetical protein